MQAVRDHLFLDGSHLHSLDHGRTRDGIEGDGHVACRKDINRPVRVNLSTTTPPSTWIRNPDILLDIPGPLNQKCFLIWNS
jgi:hypothetical protein